MKDGNLFATHEEIERALDPDAEVRKTITAEEIPLFIDEVALYRADPKALRDRAKTLRQHSHNVYKYHLGPNPRYITRDKLAERVFDVWLAFHLEELAHRLEPSGPIEQ